MVLCECIFCDRCGEKQTEKEERWQCHPSTMQRMAEVEAKRKWRKEKKSAFTIRSMTCPLHITAWNCIWAARRQLAENYNGICVFRRFSSLFAAFKRGERFPDCRNAIIWLTVETPFCFHRVSGQWPFATNALAVPPHRKSIIDRSNMEYFVRFRAKYKQKKKLVKLWFWSFVPLRSRRNDANDIGVWCVCGVVKQCYMTK